MKKNIIQLSDHFTFKRLLRFTFPAIIMMVFTSLYTMVDGFFVSNFVGKTAFAAVNYIMPILLILGAVGLMFGTGGSALISKTLGEGKKQLASELFSMVIYTLIGFSLILAAAGILFLRPIAQIMGADGQLLEDSLIYGRAILAALPFNMLQYGFQCLFASAEKPHLKNLRKKNLTIIAIFSLLIFFSGQVLAKPMSKGFVGYDSTLFDMTVHAFILFSFSFLMSGFSIYASSFFTALNDGVTSALIAFLRTFIFRCILVLLLPLLWGLDGIWLSAVFAEILALLVSFGFLVGKRKKYHY